ncbi:MAG: DUF5678 domain-containing protein [Blastocatellia bacterium]
METLTAENILQLIDQMPDNEQVRLRNLLEQREGAHGPVPDPRLPAATPSARPTDIHLPPSPMPGNGMAALQWISGHGREYAGQWVALDGSRLIAHGPDHNEVWSAALADGASLPMVTFVEDPDHIVHLLWA